MPTEFSDQLLLASYCGGDRGAFDAIYRRYAARIHATAYRLTGSYDDAEDTLQEVFLRLVREAASIRSGGALGAWLYRTAVNHTIDVRRRRRRVLFSLDSGTEAAVRVIAIESLRRHTLQREGEWQQRMLGEIGALVPRLPERQAAVFVLHGFQGLSLGEIAEILRCKEGNCRAAYSLACGKLREWVAEGERAEEASARRRMDGKR